MHKIYNRTIPSYIVEKALLGEYIWHGGSPDSDGVEDGAEAVDGVVDGQVHGQVRDHLAIYHHGRDPDGYTVEERADGYIHG